MGPQVSYVYGLLQHSDMPSMASYSIFIEMLWSKVISVFCVSLKSYLWMPNNSTVYVSSSHARYY